MRRYWKSILFSLSIVTISAFVVFTQKFSIGGNEFGSDAVLGLQLGLDLQGGSHLVYQSDLKDVWTIQRIGNLLGFCQYQDLLKYYS